MSVGSRTQDDRRRRRLAVTGDGASETGGLAILRERNVDLPGASPWLPRALWKRCLIGGVFWLALIGVAVLLIRPFEPHPQLAPAIDHLTGGPRPVLGVYADIALWSLAAGLATLVGWFRSHSQSDFHGRYRLWTWAAIVFLAWGFCAGTDIHTAVGAVAGPQLRWPVWRAEIVVWLVPAMAAGLSVWWLVGRDFTRSRLNVVLMRFAIMALLLTGVGRLYQPVMAGVPWFDGALIGGQFFGLGLLITGLWLHAGYVAYVCADPPDPKPPVNWLERLIAVFGWLASWLWPFGRGTAKSRAKKSETEAPKRRRRTAAKPKRRSRTRTKPDAEEDADESPEDNSEDETEESAEEDEEWAEEEDEEPAPPPKPAAPAKSPPTTPVRAAAPQPPSKTVSASTKWSDDDSDDADDEDDEGSYRVDGTHAGGDPFKGLSKRQRRELKKQMRDQERQR